MNLSTLRLVHPRFERWVAVLLLTTLPTMAMPVYSPEPIRAVGGGGISSGSGFKLSGSIGQPFVNMPTGRVFSLPSGFWPGAGARPAVVPGCLVLHCPTNVTAPCQSTNGAFVFFEFSATNQCAPSDLSASCAPPSGSLFPIGETSVICRAVGSGQTNQCSFTVTVFCTAPPLACRGSVLDSLGRPLVDVSVTLTGSVVRTVFTDTAGRYEFAGLPSGGSFTVTPSAPSHLFSPSNRTFVVPQGDFEADFIVTTPLEQWQMTQFPQNTPPNLRLPEAGSKALGSLFGDLFSASK